MNNKPTRQYRTAFDLLYGETKSFCPDKPAFKKKTLKKAPALRIPTEYQEQVSFIRWVASNPILSFMFHIPNGGHRSLHEGVKFKALGVKRGVPDLFLPLPRNGKHGLWIEFKRTVGGKVSVEQQTFLDKMTSLGYEVAVCRGCEEAIRVTKSYANI